MHWKWKQTIHLQRRLPKSPTIKVCSDSSLVKSAYVSCVHVPCHIVTTVYVRKKEEDVYNALLLDSLTVHDFKLQVGVLHVIIQAPTLASKIALLFWTLLFWTCVIFFYGA